MTGDDFLLGKGFLLRTSAAVKKLGLLLICCFLISCTAGEKIHPLEKAFSALEVEAEKMRIVVWRCIAEDFLEPEEMQPLLDAAVKLLDAEIISEANTQQQEFSSCIILAQAGGIKLSLTAQGVPQASYIIISAECDMSCGSFSDLAALLGEAVGEPYSVNALLVGSCPGNMQEQWQKQIESAIAACGAELVEITAEESYCSSTARCPFLQESELSGGRHINLQLAASYDEQEDRSFYYLGYPLLYIDY